MMELLIRNIAKKQVSEKSDFEVMVTQPPIFAFQDAFLEFENSVKPVQRQNRKNQH